MNFNVKQEVADANNDDTDGNEAVAVSILPMLIPISEGQCYTCTNNVAVRVGGTRFGVDNETVDSEYTNRCYFIPLKHAVAEVIPAPAP